MGKAVIKETNDGISINCVRGPASKMNIIVKNRLGEEFYCPILKKIFEVMPAGRPVEVFEKDTLVPRKFMREYLTYVSNTEWNKN